MKNGDMTTVNITLGKWLKCAELHIASDWHIGDVHCDMNGIRGQIEYVANTPNAYLICNGDLINNATKASVSDDYSETLSPMEQLNTLLELLTPIKDKILCLTQGNHESRTYRQDGIDLTLLTARQLGIENRYLREGGVLFLKLGERGKADGNKPALYSIYVTHGSGGGRKAGAKAARLEDMNGIVDTDIYIHSHTHLPMIMRQAFFRTNNMRGTINLVDKLFVNTAAQLGYGGYGQTFEFRPNSKQNPVIYLSGTEKRFGAKM